MPKLPLLCLMVSVAVFPMANVASATVTSLGGNTYSVTHEATTTFNRDLDKLTEEAKAEATRFCADKGRQPKFVSIEVEKPWVALGIPKATVVFSALEPGDPELADSAPVPVMRKGKKTKMAQPVAAPSPVDELYRSLTKLDELRQKGLLTDDEFQAEKKKVLDRSK